MQTICTQSSEPVRRVAPAGCSIFNRKSKIKNQKSEGSALIAVVAILVIIALMGTTYLITVRTDRDVVFAQGAVVADTDYPAANPANMDTAETTALTLVQTTLRDALRPDPAQPFRNPAAAAASLPPLRYDHPASSLFLASKGPESRRNIPSAGGNDTNPAMSYWPNISGPFRIGTVEIAMESPLDMTGAIVAAPAVPATYGDPLDTSIAANHLWYSGTSKTDRANLRIGSLRLTYPAAFAAPAALADKTRIFPAFVENDSTTARYLAADADGNGTADSALFRLDIAPDVLTYATNPGVNHPVTYWAAIRIVDNNAQVNLNTAYLNADQTFGAGGGADVATTSLEHGFLGAFRSNVNLESLLDPTPAPPADHLALDLQRLRLARFAGLTGAADLPASAATPVDDLPAGTTRNRTDFAFITQGDAFEHQLARRLGNPGAFLDGSVVRRYRAFPATDIQSTAFRDGLLNPNMARSQTEQALHYSSVVSAPNYTYDPKKTFAFYPANAADVWFASSFTDNSVNTPANQRSTFLSTGGSPLYAAVGNVPPLPLRSFATTSNPLLPTVVAHDMATLGANAGATADLMPVHRSGAALLNARNARLVNVNRAPFGELWRAYWDVMSHNSTAGAAYAGTETRMFRPGDRHSTKILDAAHQMLLRAAGAAVNTIRFRDSANPSIATRRDIPEAGATLSGTVYSITPQLFLTEVYASTDNETVMPTGQNPSGYVALELHNPFRTAINAINYRILVCSRAAGTLTVVSEIPFNTLQSGGAAISTLSVPAGGHIVLENYQTGGTANFRPAAAAGTFASTYYCDNLADAFGNEIIIVGPRNPTTAGLAATSADLMPIDSFSFVGLTVAGPLGPPAVPGDPEPTKTVEAWHYARVNGSGAGDQWKCVYPGAYFPGRARQRQEGTQNHTWTVTRAQSSENEPAAWAAHGSDLAGAGTPNPTFGGADATATYARVYAIQLAKNSDTGNFPAPNATTATNNRFPFGGFARNGDILNVPFLSASRIMTNAGATIAELTPISMAAAFADDADDATASNNTIEQLGRFIPLKSFDRAYTGTDTYEFASRLFDYLTAVSQPRDDASPNLLDYAGGTAPEPIKNDLTGTANTNEDTLPIHGLININTAPWQVLATVPWVRPGDTGVADQTAANDTNRRIAKAIVRFRDIDDKDAATVNAPHGAFKSLFELNLVPDYTAGEIDDSADVLAFRDVAVGPAAGAIDSADLSQAHGELTARNTTSSDDPAYTAGHNPRYKQRLLVLTRVSNLLTTRSDSFTVYVLVQAWQDAGTRYPVLVGERRSAYTMNRKAPVDNNDYSTDPMDQAIETTGLLAN